MNPAGVLHILFAFLSSTTSYFWICTPSYPPS
jgi:hypothetical protein